MQSVRAAPTGADVARATLSLSQHHPPLALITYMAHKQRCNCVLFVKEQLQHLAVKMHGQGMHCLVDSDGTERRVVHQRETI